ncbi:thioester domain-containing protein [Amycolatopsis pittospori]|uniref:thioester domain-containing protein n=1 Tax=Amycolatopsis pittospori TaxID=2749434 RepID=UPI0015F0CFA2|nr:thioester domain-containing protein [Amycolatopsis pittospori]
MHGRSVLVRGGIAVASAAVALTVAAPAALADDGAARGRVVESAGTGGFGVNFEGGKHADTVLFTLKLSDGSKLKMYCVQVEVRMRTDQDMIERPWNKYPDTSSPFNKNNEKINWVLHHGYPAASAKALESTLGKTDVKLNGGLSVEEAVTATQAAVWHFSDGKNLDRAKPISRGGAEEAADVLALYDYLTGKENAGLGKQPKPTLDIGPAKADGAPGTRIGPFSIATSGDITELTSKLPEGVKVTDADGKAIKAADVKDGTKVYIDVPKDAKDGSGTFSLKVSGHLDTGRLFVGENYSKVPAQSLIVAESEKTSVAANATANWKQGGAPATSAAPAPTTPGGAESGGGNDLANTGASATMPLVIGGSLLGAGVLMVLLVRRRRNAA